MMKEVTAIIRSGSWPVTWEKLREAGFSAVTRQRAYGRGKQRDVVDGLLAAVAAPDHRDDFHLREHRAAVVVERAIAAAWRKPPGPGVIVGQGKNVIAAGHERPSGCKQRHQQCSASDCKETKTVHDAPPVRGDQARGA